MLLRNVPFFDDYLSIVSKMPVKTIWIIYVNSHASYVNYVVGYVANILILLLKVTFIPINYMIFLPLMVSFAGTDTYLYQSFISIHEWNDHIEIYYEIVTPCDW